MAQGSPFQPDTVPLTVQSSSPTLLSLGGAFSPPKKRQRQQRQQQQHHGQTPRPLLLPGVTGGGGSACNRTFAAIPPPPSHDHHDSAHTGSVPARVAAYLFVDGPQVALRRIFVDAVAACGAVAAAAAAAAAVGDVSGYMLCGAVERDVLDACQALRDATDTQDDLDIDADADVDAADAGLSGVPTAPSLSTRDLCYCALAAALLTDASSNGSSNVGLRCVLPASGCLAQAATY